MGAWGVTVVSFGIRWTNEVSISCALAVQTCLLLGKQLNSCIYFWGLWQRSLEEVLPVNPDLVFASEGYGFKLAEVLGARFVPVDMSRLEFPISGTQIRQNPFGHWEFLAAASRSYYLKRVCIFGPESCGKTTLARALAERYGTIMVPEYARTHLDSQNGDISQKDIPLIAKGHLASEKALLKHANRMAFLDTDLLLTTIWSRWLYDDCPEWIQREALDRSADLYILVGIDTPWVDDGVRYLPTERQSFLERCHDVLTSAGKPFVFVEGSHHDRMASVEVAIRENFGEFF